jgi:hypothetical protein
MHILAQGAASPHHSPQIADLGAKEAHRVRVQTRVRFQRRGFRSPIRARTREPESKEEPDFLWTPESESKGGSDLLWTGEPESKGESDFLWTPESESKGESDLLWTGESKSKLRLAFEMAFERWLSCDAWPGRTARRAGPRPR